MSTAVAEEIEVKDVGPVEHLSIPLPPGGGLVVIRGPQDHGKSKTLEAVDYAVTGNGSIEKRDGSTKGTITIGEATVSVVKQARRQGFELVASSLDGRLKISDLIDPGLKDPEKNDAVRIKALVQLAGVTPDITLFHDLAGGKAEFDEIVGPDATETDDIVTMAARVKRHFEAAARKASDLAENYTGNALGHREAALGYDPEVEADSEKLQLALEAAIREQQRLESEQKAAAAHNARIVEAREAIKNAQEASAFPPVHEAQTCENEARNAKKAAADEVELLTESLREARVRLAKAEAAHVLAVKTLQGAEQHAKTLAAWSDTAKLDGIEVDETKLQAARDQVASARKAVEQGALQRDKAVRQAKADTSDRMANEARKRSEKLRDAAKATDEVLSQLVGRCGTPWRVERGRLVTNHKRGTIPVSELSDGTRSKVAIDIGIAALARMGVPDKLMILTLPQRIYGEFQPKTRKEIDDHARKCGVHVLTAEATDDEELSAEPFTA